MKLQRINLTPKQLLSIPDEERSLIVVLGHALNEINTLNKLLFLCAHFNHEPRWLAHAHSSQAYAIARPLVGKLNEAWDVARKGYFGTKLSKSYKGNLEPSVINALDYLKSYFGRKNLICDVRNNFAFHYSLEHAKTSVPENATSDDLTIYLHSTNGNSLYFFAEYLMNKALIETISPMDAEKALGIFFDEMSKVIANLNEFVQWLIFVVLDKYIGVDRLRDATETVELDKVPQSSEIHIPFFFEVSQPDARG